MTETPWSAAEVIRALYGHFAGRHTFLTEVPAMGHREGFLDRSDWRATAMTPHVRYIDVLLIGPPSSKPAHERIAIEVKISRADFRRDTAEKREWWQALGHRFAYATPKGLITATELPPGCGLIEVERVERDTARPLVGWTVRAPRRTDEPEPFSAYLSHYFAGRAARAEAHLKGLSWESRRQESDPEVLRDLLHEERKARTSAERRLADYRSKRASATDLLSALSPQVCAHCAEPIKPKAGRVSTYAWAHASKDVERACRAAWQRAADERYAARQAAAADGWTHREFYGVHPAGVDLHDDLLDITG